MTRVDIRVGAFVTICEEDVVWASRLLAEVERLDMPFAINFDRCSEGTKELFRSHALFVGGSGRNDPSVEFNEKHKQEALDILVELGFHWGLGWDMDETWDKDIRSKLKSLNSSYDYARVQWVNCWNDSKHIRVDTLFANARRVKLYNLQGRRKWYFDHPITYGCKMVDSKGCVLEGVGKQLETGIVCVHHGLMTRELREFHKARWDRIYTTAVGNNPYGFWNYCLDEETYPPTIIPNPYSP